MKRKLLLTLILLSLAAAARGEESKAPVNLTLGQALDLAFTNNPSIKMADEALKAANARLRQKQSGYFPALAVEASYAHLDPDPLVAFPGLGTIQFFPVDNYDAHLSLRQNLFDFGRTSGASKMAGYEVSVARNNAVLARTGLAFATIQSFYSILLLRESVEVQKQELDSLNESLALAKKKFEAGTATDFDVLTIQVKVEEAKDRKIDLENSLNKQMINFRRLTGLNDGAEVSLTGELSTGTEEIDENKAILKALETRLELKNARDMNERALAGVKTARSEHYPKIDLSLVYGVKNGYFPDLDQRLTDTVGAAQFELPLFNGLKTFNQVKEAKANLASVTARGREVEDMIIAEVREAVSDLKANVEKIKAAELHVELALKAVSQAKLRYGSGIITNLDLINAETSLEEAKLMRLQSIYSYIVSREALKKAVGESLWKENHGN